ncbi:MAG: OmpA family protein [Saprospiraceae bacterium]
MKNIFLLACFFTLTSSMFAQNRAYDRYTLSGGLLGALNLNKFRLTGDNLREFEFKTKLGWSAGAWLSLPLSHALSIEPQVMYSYYEYQSINKTADLLPYGNLTYISVPILLKIHPRHDLAITLGPQFDFLGKVTDSDDYVLKEHFSSTSISMSAGIEILPHHVISIFGRYIYGLSDLDNRDIPADDVEYYNNNIQVGVKLKLFGKMIPADTDGDGIVDDDDLCPTVAGLATMGGCPDTDGDGITDANDKCPAVAGIARYDGCPIPDTDNDGVNDEVDKCITVAGVARYDGCPVPDTDGDGVNDENDKCLTVAGLEKYNGCPIPDTDGDGVNDEVDKCPTVAGLAIHNGCPPPDRDNDGVTNDKDLCPDVAGPASNFGCPVVESAKFNARMINFKTGSAELTPKSKLSLREGAALMNSSSFTNLVFHIHGHTDSDGSYAFNHDLSHRRAASVRAELIKNGVSADRMTSEGFGEKEPIATNQTAAGKALNRRVEILARHSQQLGEPVIVPKN